MGKKRKRNRKKKTRYEKEAEMVVLKGDIDRHVDRVRIALEDAYNYKNAGELSQDKADFIATHAFGYSAYYARMIASTALDLINQGSIINAEIYLEKVIEENLKYEHQAKVKYSPTLVF